MARQLALFDDDGLVPETRIALARFHERAARRATWLGSLPPCWDRRDPAYVHFGLGPVLDLARDALWSLRAQDRW